MANYKENIVDIELTKGHIHRSFYPHALGAGDENADRFGFRLFRNGQPENITGNCFGLFVRPDGETVPIESGVVSGNTAYVILPDDCYVVEGVYSLAIKVSGGGVTGTMRIVDGMVDRTSTDVIVDPGTILPTIDDLIEAINEAVATIPPDYSDLSDLAELTFNGVNNDNLVSNKVLSNENADYIITNYKKNIALGAIQESGEYDSNQYRIHDTTKHIIYPNESYVYDVSCAADLGVMLSFFDEDDTYLGSTSYVPDGGTFVIPNTNYPEAAYFTTQMYNNDTAAFTTDYFIENPVMLKRREASKSSLSVVALKSAGKGIAKATIGKITSEGQMWQYGGFSYLRTGGTINKIQTNASKNRLSILYIPFYSKAFRIDLASGYKYMHALHDNDKQVVGWTYGGTWDTGSRTYNVGYDVDVSYLSICIGKSDDTNFTDDEKAEIEGIVTITPLDHISPLKIRLMSYNIGHYCWGTGSSFDEVGLTDDIYDLYVGHMKEFFTEYHPDVLCLCEYWNYLDRAKQHSSDTVLFNPLYQYKNQSTQWNAMKSNYCLFNKRDGLLNVSSTKRYYLSEIRDGDITVGIMVVHLDAINSTLRFDELAQAISIMSSYKNAVICGDFNTSSDSDLETLTSVCNSNGYIMANGGYLGWKNTHPYNEPNKKLDNIIVKGNCKIMNFRVLTSVADDLCSDHLPIYAELTFFE